MDPGAAELPKLLLLPRSCPNGLKSSKAEGSGKAGWNVLAVTLLLLLRLDFEDFRPTGASSGSFMLSFMAICLACSRLAFMEADDRLSGLYFIKAKERRLLDWSLRTASCESRELEFLSRCGEAPKRLLIWQTACRLLK